MIHWIGRRIGCMFGRHLRSVEKARYPGNDRDKMTSVCTYCGVPMKRLFKRNWVVDRGK